MPYVSIFWIAVSGGLHDCPGAKVQPWTIKITGSVPRGRLNIKMLFYHYGDPHVQDKTVSRPSYLQHGNPHTWENGLYIETGPGHNRTHEYTITGYKVWDADIILSTLCNDDKYLCILRFKLIHVSKRPSWTVMNYLSISLIYISNLFHCEWNKSLFYWTCHIKHT